MSKNLNCWADSPYGSPQNFLTTTVHKRRDDYWLCPTRSYIGLRCRWSSTQAWNIHDTPHARLKRMSNTMLSVCDACPKMQN
jgi:hypothetical protein